MPHKPGDIDRDKLPPLPDIEPLTPSESLRTPLTRPDDANSAQCQPGNITC